jgi:hypothetical protein
MHSLGSISAIASEKIKYYSEKGKLSLHLSYTHLLSTFCLLQLVHFQIFYESLEMPVPSQGHYGFHSFPVVD